MAGLEIDHDKMVVLIEEGVAEGREMFIAMLERLQASTAASSDGIVAYVQSQYVATAMSNYGDMLTKTIAEENIFEAPLLAELDKVTKHIVGEHVGPDEDVGLKRL